MGRERPRICWASDFWMTGNAYGYSRHNRMMREHVSRIADLDSSAPDAVTIISADRFVPVPGKRNFLFTMFETNHLPPAYVKNLHLADHLIVPCRHNVSLFKKYTDLPVSLCPEGVDPAVYRYIPRKRPVGRRRFRFLWIGAPNPRKGFVSVLEAFRPMLGKSGIELYIKTTSPEGLVHDEFASRALAAARNKPQRLSGNVIFDVRNLPEREMIGLYRDAHCFLMPSLGEGWGLTLCEALATGLPAIATRWAGHEDFFDEEIGYPLKHEIKPYYVETYGLPTEIAIPDTLDLYSKMCQVLRYYETALEKGRAASERIRTRFTWEKAAQRLVEIVEGHSERAHSERAHSERAQSSQLKAHSNCELSAVSYELPVTSCPGGADD